MQASVSPTLNHDEFVYGIVSTGLFSVMVIDENFGKRALVSLPRLTNDNVLGELHMLENYFELYTLFNDR